MAAVFTTAVTSQPPKRYFFFLVVPPQDTKAAESITTPIAAAVRHNLCFFLSIPFYINGIPFAAQLRLMSSGHMDAWISPIWALRR